MQMIGRAHETTVGDTSIAWGEMGSGEPLVLLHGMLDSHRTWRRSAPLLAERFRVLMPDMPGHGLSARPDAPRLDGCDRRHARTRLRPFVWWWCGAVDDPR
jgi:pimeloyl-ACP methyl ester carboxylesterase